MCLSTLFFMSFLLLCSFQRAFCFGFFPNRFAVPRKVRPRSLLRVPRFSSSRLALRKKSFAKLFASVFSVWLRCCSKTLVRVDDYAFLAFPSLRLAIRKIPSQNPSGSLRSSTGRMYPSFRVPESLQENHLLRLSPQQKQNGGPR